MISPEDTIAAIATPLGEGGLGVIRISGTQAIEVASALFRGNDLAKAASHTCHVGFLQEYALVDQVVLTLFRAPHSYTGEHVVEISAHGNPFTLQKILNLCLFKGARLAGPGEFTERAFLNGKMDLTQAEAVADLIHAKTSKSQAAALHQLQGRLAQEIRRLREQLLPLLAHVEVGLDHSDEDHDFLSRDRLIAGCQQVQNAIASLLESAKTSKILREGFKVALVGKPNVGKSSLLNALIKEERAIVTPIPGTTRDTLEESVHWDGIPVILTDTAGLRSETQDPVEKLGMERTHRSLLEADVVIGLFDGSEEFSPEDQDMVRQAMKRPHVWVINKSDLPQHLSPHTLNSFNGRAPVVNLSAKTGQGLNDLIQTIKGLALGEKAQASEAQWLLNARHEAALQRAQSALARAKEAAATEAFEECVALELQSAMGALGEIIGETTTEDLLDQIFSKFCIGK